MFNGIKMKVSVAVIGEALGLDAKIVAKLKADGKDTIEMLAFENGSIFNVTATNAMAFLSTCERAGNASKAYVAGKNAKGQKVLGLAYLCGLAVVDGHGLCAVRTDAPTGSAAPQAPVEP